MPDPIQLISALLDKVAGEADVEESAEWYLRSNLIDYKRVLLRKTSSQEIEFATGALMSFCALHLDEGMPVYQACSEIAEEGAKIGVRLKLSGR